MNQQRAADLVLRSSPRVGRHYIPEVQAQCTLVNFTVTEKGLEDQLLSKVVGFERPDMLQEQKDLVEMQNNFTIELKRLGDNLLYLLATAEGDILANEALIITLEETKATVKEINEKQKVAAAKEIEIAKAFESYRPNANRGSLIYFLMNLLNVVDPGPIKDSLPALISCAVAVHMQVANQFVPSAVKFHYQVSKRLDARARRADTRARRGPRRF